MKKTIMKWNDDEVKLMGQTHLDNILSEAASSAKQSKNDILSLDNLASEKTYPGFDVINQNDSKDLNLCVRCDSNGFYFPFDNYECFSLLNIKNGMFDDKNSKFEIISSKAFSTVASSSLFSSTSPSSSSIISFQSDFNPHSEIINNRKFRIKNAELRSFCFYN